MTYNNVYSDAFEEALLVTCQVSVDSENIETTLAIHEFSEHVKPGHFDWTFIENIIGHHISEEGMAKVKESARERLKALYMLINYAWK